MRFGKIQNIDDIDKAFEDLDKQHSDLLGSVPTFRVDYKLGQESKSAIDPNAQHTLKNIDQKAELEQMRLSRVREMQRNLEPENEMERQLNEISKDMLVRKRLLAAYGSRMPNIGSVGVNHMNQKYEEFYANIPEEKQTILQSRLSQKFSANLSETVNHDFISTHLAYVEQYQGFLRSQRYADGLLRQLLKEFNNARNYRKMINTMPKLEEPKIFSDKNEIAKEILNTKKIYADKMELVSNKFLKYDVKNDGLLEEVGRFIEFGNQQVDSESVMGEAGDLVTYELKRKQMETDGLVDQLLNKIELKQSVSLVDLHKSQAFGQT